jgi:hypothetical protein
LDIDQDIRDYVLATLPYDPAKRAELEAKSAPELLITYLNWFFRLIPSARRRAHQSRALQSNPLATTHKADLDALLSKMVSGADLTPHLSTRIQTGYEPQLGGSYARRADLDLLLAEWRVHHLHLSSNLRADGVAERTGPLLFAAFTPYDVYLINVFYHGDWSREAIAQIMIEEWPNSEFVHEAKGIIGLEHYVNDEERAQLRSAGINSPFIPYNGKYYMVGRGGITSAGTAVEATRAADYFYVAARAFADHVTADPEYVANTLRDNGFSAPEQPDLHFAFVNDGNCCIVERTTGARFHL